MALFEQLNNNPPTLTVKVNAREVIVSCVSAMCDNKSRLTFRKNDNGEFRVTGNGNCLSNWQMTPDDYQTDMEWAADDQDWNTVFEVINTGTTRVASVRSR